MSIKSISKSYKEKLFSETDELASEEVSQTNIEEDIKNEIKDEENKKISREIKRIRDRNVRC